MTFKQFKTNIRKKIGCVNIGEFVENPVTFNSKESWDSLFSNKKFIKQYDMQSRLETYKEVIRLLDSYKVFDNVTNMIDFGCGTGQFIAAVLKEHPEIECTGTDFSLESIEICKRMNISVNFYVSDIYTIRNDIEKKYDLVVCSEVLEHLTAPEKALKNLLELLAPNTGKLVITVPNGRLDKYEGHIHFWSPESFKLFIENVINTKIYKCSFSLFNNRKNILAIISFV